MPSGRKPRRSPLVYTLAVGQSSAPEKPSAAAEGLAHLPVDVALVDQHDYHTFKPLIYQVATALLNAEDVDRPVRALFQHQDNLTVRQATATRIDWRAHQLVLEEGRPLPFDYLVVATPDCP